MREYSPWRWLRTTAYVFVLVVILYFGLIGFLQTLTWF